MSDNDLIWRGSVLERLDLAEYEAEERDWRSGANEITRIRKFVAAIPAVTPAVAVKPLKWTVAGEILVATGPEVRVVGHVIPAEMRDKYDAERAASILDTLTLTPTPVADSAGVDAGVKLADALALPVEVLQDD